MNKVYCDAIGNPIEIGKTYGYSTSSGGWARTVIGSATKITEKGNVALAVIKVNRFLYGDPSESRDDAKTVSIRTHMVFPIHD